MVAIPKVKFTVHTRPRKARQELIDARDGETIWHCHTIQTPVVYAKPQSSILLGGEQNRSAVRTGGRDNATRFKKKSNLLFQFCKLILTEGIQFPWRDFCPLFQHYPMLNLATLNRIGWFLKHHRKFSLHLPQQLLRQCLLEQYFPILQHRFQSTQLSQLTLPP